MEKFDNEVNDLNNSRDYFKKRLSNLLVLTICDGILTLSMYGISVACLVVGLTSKEIPLLVSLIPLPTCFIKTIPFIKEYFPELKAIKKEIKNIDNELILLKEDQKGKNIIQNNSLHISCNVKEKNNLYSDNYEIDKPLVRKRKL